MSEAPNKPRISPQALLASRTALANSVLYGNPWDSIQKISELASQVVQYPPEHPEKKRAEIIAKLAEIQRLADEVLNDMPKSKSRRGSVQAS